MIFNRSSGILLHITSLPGKFGIGDIGREAHKFIDFLAYAKQSYWQILPIGPTGDSYSPYTLFSSFAGNSAFISLELIVEDGYLRSDDLESSPQQVNGHSNFGEIIKWKDELLVLASKNYFESATSKEKNEFRRFCDENKFWLDDFSLFIILKKIHNHSLWTDWTPEFSERDPNALGEIRTKYSEELDHIKLVQYFFHKQWEILCKYAHQNNVQIIGDVPIYVAHDSADVWANQTLFHLDKKGNLDRQSGVPPCIFSKTGQLWGNPIYKWENHKKTGYKWWISQIKKLFTMVDVIRIDHFNGFVKYWEVPAGNKTAKNGKWVDGPGEDFFTTLTQELGSMPIFAEDLGEIAEEARPVREKFGYPGLIILQFAFSQKNFNADDFPKSSVVYTGTHDNDTTVGWFNTTKGNSIQTDEDILAERKAALDYLRTNGENIHWDMIELALSTKSNTAIIPIQDVMGLDSKARMNIPGKANGNWTWRFTWDMLTTEMVTTLKDLTIKHNRYFDTNE